MIMTEDKEVVILQEEEKEIIDLDLAAIPILNPDKDQEINLKTKLNQKSPNIMIKEYYFSEFLNNLLRKMFAIHYLLNTKLK